MEDQLKKFCCGKSKSRGGLNKDEFIDYIRSTYPHVNINNYYSYDNLKENFCQSIELDCGVKYKEEYRRPVDKIEETIRTNPRYKDFRKFAKKIAMDFVSSDYCELCGAMMDVEEEKIPVFLRDAIDHDHHLEGTGYNSYRGRLCMSCNTREGRILKNFEDFTSYIKKLAEEIGISEAEVYKYVTRTIEGHISLIYDRQEKQRLIIKNGDILSDLYEEVEKVINKYIRGFPQNMEGFFAFIKKLKEHLLSYNIQDLNKVLLAMSNPKHELYDERGRNYHHDLGKLEKKISDMLNEYFNPNADNWYLLNYLEINGFIPDN